MNSSTTALPSDRFLSNVRSGHQSGCQEVNSSTTALQPSDRPQSNGQRSGQSGSKRICERPAAIPPVAAAISPVGGVSTTGFNEHAGEVMASPRVFAIYWGRDYGSPTAGMNARATGMDTFFATVMTSTYMTMLAEYSVGQGAFLGSTWLDHNPGTAQTIDFNQMRDILISWIDAGMVAEAPAWNERDLLFVIFPPAEVTLVDRNGAGGFCGYHWYGHYRNSPLQKDNLFFAVIDTTGGTER